MEINWICPTWAVVDSRDWGSLARWPQGIGLSTICLRSLPLWFSVPLQPNRMTAPCAGSLTLIPNISFVVWFCCVWETVCFEIKLWKEIHLLWLIKLANTNKLLILPCVAVLVGNKTQEVAAGDGNWCTVLESNLTICMRHFLFLDIFFFFAISSICLPLVLQTPAFFW
jgi:hypothetical protein